MARTTNYLQSWKDKIKQIGTSVQQKVQEVTGVDPTQNTNNIKNILKQYQEAEKNSLGQGNNGTVVGGKGSVNQNNTASIQKESPIINNNDDRFLSWYKNQFGKDYAGDFNKTDSMSDQDYEQGNNLYQAYLQKENLANQTNSALSSLEESKSQQRQEASILRDKMAKYIQLQNQNNGFNNLGVSESTALQADSKYMSNLGSIESQANANKTNILNNYFNNKTNIDTDAAANEQSILNKYQQYAREDEQKEYERKKYEEEQTYKKEQDEYNKQRYEDEFNYQKQQDELDRQRYDSELEYQKQQDEYSKQKAIQDSAFNEFMTIVESGSFNTAAELEAFYNSFKGNLSPEQQAIAEQQINFYKNNPSQQEMDKENEQNRTGIIKEQQNEDGTTTIVIRDENGQEHTIIKDADGNIIDQSTQDSEALAKQKEEEKKQRILEGKEYIEYKGKNYQLKSQLKTNANEIKNNDSFSSQLKKLGFSNPYDSNIPDGTTFTINCDSSGSDKFDFSKDVLGTALNPWRFISNVAGLVGVNTGGGSFSTIKKTVTYYQGNWYISQKK